MRISDWSSDVCSSDLHPTKLVDGKWTKVSWEQAIDEIGGKMLEIYDSSGPDSVYWLGSAKHSNEQAYLFRKFYAFWGTNNRSEEHTSELQSLMRISYAVFCLKKKNELQ